VGQLGRLRRRAEFQDVYSRGSKAAGRFVVVFVAEGRGPTSRYGITVTKRVGKAVVRNRARRRLRELLRGWDPVHWPRFDLVVNVRRGCAEAPWLELSEDVLQCLVKAARRRWGLA